MTQIDLGGAFTLRRVGTVGVALWVVELQDGKTKAPSSSMCERSGSETNAPSSSTGLVPRLTPLPPPRVWFRD